jgi:hypothetical protein
MKTRNPSVRSVTSSGNGRPKLLAYMIKNNKEKMSHGECETDCRISLIACSMSDVP